jgi:hypothetical protein
MVKINSKLTMKGNKGAAMLVSLIFFLFISLAVISGLVAGSIREFRNSSMSYNSKKSYYLSESGVEDALYRILTTKTIGASEVITLDSNSATTTITSGASSKTIVANGNVTNYERKIALSLSAGEGEIFKYGTQSGQGGFIFQNNSHITGSLYSNGDIIGSNGAYITGDAYVAGTGTISNMRVGYGGTGVAQAHSVTGSTITGSLYCQSGSGNNKSCNTSRSDLPTEALPISDDDIAGWEADAIAGGVTNGNVTISSPTSIGPRKIVGNLTVNSTLTLTNTIYVTGTVTISGTVKLDSTYGTTSGIIIADGYIIINNGSVFQDSGTAGSYIMFLSNSTCDDSVAISPCFGHNAIEVSNNSNISIANAEKGTVYFSNNASVKEAVGNKIELKNNVGISYGTGLISVDFTSGPTGGWVVSSWKESQ